MAIVRFVVEQRVRKLPWQWGTLRLLVCFWRSRGQLQRFELDFNRRDIDIDQIIKLAGLGRA
jgi:hypothetical protein